MITWGISANSHDGALAVFDNNELVFASHTERFSGLKNDPHLNRNIIDYAKQWGEPDEVIWYEKPFKKTVRQLVAGQGWNYNENNIKTYLQQYNINAPIGYSNHHESHAAGGYYTSGFSDATIVVIDSIGEFETFTIWEGKGDKLKKVYSQGYPNSIGLFYSAMTQRIGLKPNEDEYILMGMAAYGNHKKYYYEIKELFFKLGAHDRWTTPSVKFNENLHRGCMWWKGGKKLTWQQKADIAAATQELYEEILMNTLAYCSEKYSSKNLVLSGGCALNCKANHLAFRTYDNVWIMPNPGDAGSSVGAVLANNKQHIKWNDAYLGYNIEGDYPVEQLLKELQTKNIVGVANGRAEFGPRALGNRSLLADPRGTDIKDTVNRIKKRQKFRPFAPVVLSEYASKHFRGNYNNYMQFTSHCTDPDLYPAITHVDGTSRVQTVGPNGSGIRKLLEAWFEATGCPMLLNTSLNIKGKPMVNDKKDAKAFAKKYGVSVY
jgi:carbamoyltransferase